jgi:hypothetical protein
MTIEPAAPAEDVSSERPGVSVTIAAAAKKPARALRPAGAAPKLDSVGVGVSASVGVGVSVSVGVGV